MNIDLKAHDTDLDSLTITAARQRLASCLQDSPDSALDTFLIDNAERGLRAQALVGALRAIIVLESPEFPTEPSIIRDIARSALAAFNQTSLSALDEPAFTL